MKTIGSKSKALESTTIIKQPKTVRSKTNLPDDAKTCSSSFSSTSENEKREKPKKPASVERTKESFQPRRIYFRKQFAALVVRNLLMKKRQTIKTLMV